MPINLIGITLHPGETPTTPKSFMGGHLQFRGPSATQGYFNNPRDLIYVGKCVIDKRVPEHERMNTSAIAKKIGDKACWFDDNEDLLNRIVQDAKPGDVIIFMSSGSFSGVQHRLLDQLRQRF